MNIEIGMLVRIVTTNNDRMKHMIGHIGQILSRNDVYTDHWHIEGAEKNIEGNPCCWFEGHLVPVHGQGVSTWRDVEKYTKWNPTEAKDAINHEKDREKVACS